MRRLCYPSDCFPDEPLRFRVGSRSGTPPGGTGARRMRETASSNVVFSFKDSDAAPGFLRGPSGSSVLFGMLPSARVDRSHT